MLLLLSWVRAKEEKKLQGQVRIHNKTNTNVVVQIELLSTARVPVVAILFRDSCMALLFRDSCTRFLVSRRLMLAQVLQTLDLQPFLGSCFSNPSACVIFSHTQEGHLSIFSRSILSRG